MSSRQTVMSLLVVGLALGVVALTMWPKADVGTEPSVRVVRAAEVEWGALNPLRGDKSPRAGTLWGDRQAPVPSGFLVKFVDGFSSPPHIHPVTYRGVVVRGEVHNDLPDANETWLAPGSFWTQPAGEVHITAAKGRENVAYIEIEEGPYKVQPTDAAFEPPETPVKVAPAQMTWLTPAGGPWEGQGPGVAALAGNPNDARLTRSLLRLPEGFRGTLRSKGVPLHAVVIQGQLRHGVAALSDSQVLEPGSYFGSEGVVSHELASAKGPESLIYVRTRGEFELRSNGGDG